MQYAQARPPMAATSSSWHARPEAHHGSAQQGSVQLVDASLQELLKREGNSKAQVQRVLAAVKDQLKLRPRSPVTPSLPELERRDRRGDRGDRSDGRPEKHARKQADPGPRPHPGPRPQPRPWTNLEIPKSWSRGKGSYRPP